MMVLESPMRFQPQQLGGRICCTQTVWGFLGVFACSQTRTWGYLNRSDRETGMKKMYQPSGSSRTFTLPFGDPQLSYHPNQVPIIHELGDRFIPYTLGILTYPTTNGRRKKSNIFPQLPEKLVHMWFFPGEKPVSHSSLPTAGPATSTGVQHATPSWGRVQPSRAPAEWYRASTSRSPGNVNFKGAKMGT